MSKNKFIYPAILLLVITGMYCTAVKFPFIGYDNNTFIIENPLLGQWCWNNFIEIWKVGGVKLENLYIPLTYMTYYIETAFFGKNPYVLHFDNIILHCTNSLLLFYLGKRIGFKPLTSFLVSLLFAIHPLQVEPVVWCMGRKDLLSTLFALLCIHSYLTYFSRQKFIWLILIILFGAAAMFAKPVMVILPGILLLMEFFLLKIPAGNDPDSSKPGFLNLTFSFLLEWKIRESNKSENNFVIRKISIILLSCFSLFSVYLNLIGPFRAPSTRSPYENFLCLSYLLSGWLKRFFLCEGLQHFYRPPSRETLFSEAGYDIMILFVSLFLIIYLTVISKYKKRILFGMAFFLIAFFPPLAHLKYTQEFITADRYGYFPLIGIFISIGAFYESTSGMRKKIFVSLLSIWLIFIFIGNISAVKLWSSDINFWKNEVKTKPESYVDHYFLGLSYQHEKHYLYALKHFDKCIMEENEYTQKALIKSASIFFNIGNFREAEILYIKALNYDSQYYLSIYTDLAETYLRQKKVEPAIKAFESAALLETSEGNKNLLLARMYLYKLKYDLAKVHAEEAIKLGVDLTDDLKLNLKIQGQQK